jgi:hypothetical protein
MLRILLLAALLCGLWLLLGHFQAASYATTAPVAKAAAHLGAPETGGQPG